MIVLFAVAFVLILVSAIGQNKANENVASLKEQLEEKQSFYEGAQKSLSDITKENEFLKSENTQLKSEVEKLTKEIDGYSQEKDVQSLEEKNTSSLLKAQNLFNQRKKKEAAKELENVVLDMLNAEEKQIYEYLTGQLN